MSKHLCQVVRQIDQIVNFGCILQLSRLCWNFVEKLEDVEVVELTDRDLWPVPLKHLVQLNAQSLVAEFVDDAVAHGRVFGGLYDLRHDRELEPVRKADGPQHAQGVVKESLQGL